MGKGSRNRINHQAEPQKPQVKKKQPKVRRPLSERTKNIIAYCVCALLLVGIVVGTLSSSGTFKRSNVLVQSTDGTYDLNQQMATYMVWDALYYTGYYQWSYYSSSIKESTGITNQTQYCLYYAMSGVQDTLRTSIENYKDTLMEYVAVCDIAEKMGVTLTEEEIKTAKDEIQTTMEYMATSNSLSLNGFINYYIGSGVKMKDIKKVAVMQALYSKVVELKEGQVKDSVTEDILAKYRDDNPESFYSTDYYLYTTKDKDDPMKPLLLAATTVGEFKEVFVKDVFDDVASGYVNAYNKYVKITIGEEKESVYTFASRVLTAIEKKTSVDDLTAALTKQEMTVVEYSKDDATLNQTLKDWMFKADAAQFAAAEIDTEDKIYVVVLSSKPENGKVSAAIKTFDLQTGDTYGEGEKLDPEFKNNIYKTLLVKYEILEKADDMKLYDKSEDEVVKSILNALETAIDKALPAVKTQYYVSEPEADSFQDWMFDKDTLVSPVKAGNVKEFTKTATNSENKEETTYSVYMVKETMKLDETPLINGAYVTFEGANHATKAQEFYASLNGLTGEALKQKFTDAKGTVSEAISESSLDDELAAWLFDTARAVDNIGVVSVPNTAKEGETDNSCTYVALYQGSTPTWKNSSKNSWVNEQLTNWVKELISSYELEGMRFIKDANPAETTTTAATATA